MKKKNLLKIAALALVVILAAMSLNIFAAADELTIYFDVPSASVAEGGTFDVNVRVNNPSSVAAKKIAGLQISLSFNTELLTAEASDIEVAEQIQQTSLYAANVSNGEAIMVCVNKDFTDSEGYTTLSDLYTVTFTALTDIDDPSRIFTADSLTYVFGNTVAEAVEATTVYYGNVENLSTLLEATEEATVASNVMFEEENIGSLLTVEAPERTTANTVADIKALFSDATNITIKNSAGTVLDATAKVGTGCVIVYDNNGVTEEAVVVVKGDINGTGDITVFDAALVLKSLANIGPSFSNIEKYAADVNGSADVLDVTDVSFILKYALGTITEFAK